MPQIYWKPHPGPQTEVLTREEYEILYGGARGGGKTDAGLAWLTRWVANPFFRALVIRKNADDLKDWVDRARMMFLAAGGRVVGKPPEVRFPDGAAIITGHLKDDNAYTKYQGQEYQKIVIEELTQIPMEELYLKLISSCRSTIPGIKAQVFNTANPGGVGHVWVKNRFKIKGTPKEPIRSYDKVAHRFKVFVPARVTDNPTLMELDPNYIHFLNSLKPESLKKAWRDGSWDIFAGQYFEEWNPNVHIHNSFPIPKSWPKFRAYDHGYAKPACCKWYAVDYDGRVWVYRELYVTKWKIPKIAKRIVKLSKGEEYRWSVADSHIFANTGEEETIGQNFARHGVQFLKSDKRRVDGWNLMRQYLDWDEDNPPKLIYFNKCADSIRTLPALIQDERDPEDLDTDGEDHAADTDRYFLMGLKERKMKKIDRGIPVKKTSAWKKLQKKKEKKEDNYSEFYG